MKSLVEQRKCNFFKAIRYCIVILLFLGFSFSIASSSVPTFIFKKSNISVFAYCDLIFLIFNKASVMTLPILVLYFMNYLKTKEILSFSVLLKNILKAITHVLFYLLFIYLSIFLAYILANGMNNLNLGFTDRSALKLLIPAELAFALSVVYLAFYILAYQLISMIIETLTKKSWLAVMLTITLSFIDTGTRIIFNSANLVGLMPSDNAFAFYLDDLFYGAIRPSHEFSLIYWVILLALLSFILFLISKERSKKINNR